MTTPDDNPSFIARLSLVAQIGIILFQAFMVFYGDLEFLSLDDKKEVKFILWVIPAVSHLAVACIYFLFNGVSKLETGKQDEDSLFYFCLLFFLSLLAPFVLSGGRYYLWRW